MRPIEKDGTLIAIHFDGTFTEGTQPQTEEGFPLQVLSLKHPKGKILLAHAHTPRDRTTHELMECLVVLSGRILAKIFHENELIESIEMGPKEALMLVHGGVGYEILEDAEMMEFKNGPYLEDKMLINS